MKSIKILDKEFTVQSYLHNEYAYLVSSEKEFPSIRIEFWQKDEKQVFSSNMKTDKTWKEFVKQIDIQMEYDYFYDLYIKQEKFEKNENNLFVCYLLGFVDDFDIEKEPVMIQGEFPDIDTDFEADVCDYIRDEWAPKTFGEENVCAIGTYGTFGIKLSLIDVARVFGYDRHEVLNFTTKIGLKDEDGNEVPMSTEDFAHYRSFLGKNEYLTQNNLTNFGIKYNFKN